MGKAGSQLVFVNMGDKEKLTMADTAGPIIGKNREDGITSTGQEDGFIFQIKSINIL